MKLVLAEKTDLDSVLELYENVKKTIYCVWDDEYPTMENINFDFEHDCLYVLKDEEKVIGAISVNYENEFDDLKDVWLYTKDPCEIARLVVNPEYQNKGLGEFIIKEISKILSEKGYYCIHLAVAVNNLPAVRLYDKCGFLQDCTIYMFDNYYYFYEKRIDRIK